MSDLSLVVDDLGKPAQPDDDPTAGEETTETSEQEEQEGEERQEAEAGAAEEGEETGEDEGEEPEPKRKQRPGRSERLQARVDNLTDELQRANERVARLEGRAEVETPPPGRQQTQETERPQRDDFENDEAYVEALSEWKAARVVSQHLQHQNVAQNNEELKQAQQAVHKSWADEFRRGKDVYDDFAETVDDMDIDDNLAFMVKYMGEGGADVAYYLANHPEEVATLETQLPGKQLLALGEIRGRLISAAKPPGKKQTAAPNPPKTIGGKGGSPQKAPEDMSNEEFRAMRRSKAKG